MTTTLASISRGKPAAYPDQARYAAFACAKLGLTFRDVDSGSGFAFVVSSGERSVAFGGGRTSFTPQNTATAATLAQDKYLANAVMADKGVPTLGGNYFMLDDKGRAARPDGHARSDAVKYFRALGGRAFAKPLFGRGGEFARTLDDEPMLSLYLDAAAAHHEAVLLQPIYRARQYRVAMLDGDVMFWTRKFAPHILGDGRRSLRSLFGAFDPSVYREDLVSVAAQALNDLTVPPERQDPADAPLRSVRGTTVFAEPRRVHHALIQARRAVEALGLRAAAVDLFTDIEGEPDAVRVAEIDPDPSLAFLEESGRHDLLVTFWKHAFTAVGLVKG